ncbi:phytol kinase 1, chloroplastic isoform X2 [Tanacetum coccineum]
MANNHPHYSVVATTVKLSLFRHNICPARHSFNPITSFPNTYSPDGDIYNNNQRRLLYIPPPARALTGDMSGTLLQDAGATFLVVAGAYGLVSGFDTLTKRNIIQQISTSTDARYFAALVPLLNCARLLVHGLSLVTNEDLIKSVTREGKPEELLRGPLYYVLVLIVCSIFFWRESPIGVIALSMMCGGDGIADIMGRRFGIHKIPYNLQKSWCGSISMFIVGFLVSIGMLFYFSMFGYFEIAWYPTIGRVALVALVATLVETLPTKGGVDDNISVPMASVLLAYLTFGIQA